MTLHEQFKQLIKNIAEVRGIPTQGVSINDEGISFTNEHSNSQLLSWAMISKPIDWYAKAVQFAIDNYDVIGYPKAYKELSDKILLDYTHRDISINKKDLL